MNAPKVTIVLPARDAAPTLPAALASVRRQSHTDWECVIVDDGSTDATGTLARAAARSDPRFRVVDGPGTGVAAAANLAVDIARAALIARMDADDVMRRERLAAQVAALDDPSLTGVGTHVRLFPRSALGGGMRAYERWLNGMRDAEDVARDRFIECPLANPTLMLRRDVLIEYRWRSCDWPEDYDLVLRLLADGHRLGVVPRRLLAWRHGRGRLTTDHADYSLARFTACRANALALGPLRAHANYVLWGYGDTGRALRRALATHDKHPAHVVELHPGRLGQRIHGAPVIAPAALPEVERHPVIVSVAGAGPRAQIRAALAAMGWRETIDFWCAA